MMFNDHDKELTEQFKQAKSEFIKGLIILIVFITVVATLLIITL